MSKKLLVLGVGNLLLADEGVGVHMIHELEARYQFSEGVELMDGGTLGLRLIDYLSNCDRLLVIDAIRAYQNPGTIYRLEEGALRKSTGFSDSMHEIDLLDALNLCELATGRKPTTVVIGVEPADIKTLDPQLSPEVEDATPKLLRAILAEISSYGYTFTKNRKN